MASDGIQRRDGSILADRWENPSAALCRRWRLPILERSEIADIHTRFSRGEDGAIRQVRDWTAGVVRGGRWGFADDESVIQEILLELVKLVRDGRVNEPGGFQKYVYTVAKRYCVRQCYRERRRRQHETPEESVAEPAAEEGSPIESIEQRDRIEALGFVLQQLPGNCRGLWDQIYCQGRSSADLARELDITPNNLRVRVHRCLERARKIFRDHEMRNALRETGS